MLKQVSTDIERNEVMLPYLAFPIMDMFDVKLIANASSMDGNSSAAIKVPTVEPSPILNSSAGLDLEAIILRIGDE